MKKIRVSIVIVFYKGKENLKRCLQSIKSNVSYEIILVNNSKLPLSEIKTIATKVKNITYIDSPHNVGYGAGNNLGAKKAKGEYLFILNPDTEIQEETVETLLKFLEENKKAAIIAPNLIDEKGKVFSQLGSRELTPLRGVVALSFINKILPNNKISKHYWLKDLPMDELREVDVVPGSAFLIRKNVFEKVGMFDENFFLFFEESDLGKRIKKAGYKLFITPQAEVKHFWKAKKDEKFTNLEFAKSRFYYFKKHYGFFWAEVVELFANFSKWHAWIFLLALGAAFLRFYRLPQNLVFQSEIGNNYLAIKDMWESGKLPLLGPPTSHSWLAFAPLFYWFFGPILALGGFNPVVGSYFFALISTFIIAANFWLVKDWFDEKVAFWSSLLIAISPLWLWMAREARFFSLVTLLIYPYLFLLKDTLKGKKGVFYLGLILGLMFSFHFTPIVLFIITIFCFIALNKYKLIPRYLIGILIPNTTLLIYAFKDHFTMLSKLFVWVPYRSAKGGNAIASLGSIINFFSRSFAPAGSAMGMILGLICLTYLIYLGITVYQGNKARFSMRIFLLWSIVSLMGLFLHGEPPIHYFVVIFPIPQILLALLLTKLNEHSLGKVLVVALVSLITIINLKYFFSENWYYQSQTKINPRKSVPYAMQLVAVEHIARLADGKSIKISRKGPYDYFEGDFADNYRYLLWWKGQNLKENASLNFQIVEDKDIKIIQ